MIEQFVSDLQFENQCYAVIISSPVSSGTLSAVHVPPLPEGYAFYDAAHIPAQKTIDIFENSVPVFAEDTIAYKGQAVGILTGTDRSILEALRKEVRVAVNPIPVDGSEEQRTHDFFNYRRGIKRRVE